ncbi:hypothetical protein BGZ65_011976 [Modicella reniformis]|uniref:Pleckstrin homology domain-containing protein n=1 Tax=Modicella reniformis TaxID=1440133 RepID=A0A9P6IMF1_9FUNG|nr:hypothetical protein BGZ65_011976 [Modicella reniformis]
MSNGSNYDVTPTDLTMIQCITQTMIGDYLWKYTRRRMARSEKSHQRFVWVHPYNKTLHWSLTNPGAQGSREQRSKSASILGITQVVDETPNAKLPNATLVVQTTSRIVKLKAPTREKHDLWFQSISYLMSRPSTTGTELASDNQTWIEIHGNGDHHQRNQRHQRPHPHHGRSLSASSAHLGSDMSLSMRPAEKSNNSLRKKTSMARLQSVFTRTSVPKEGSSNSTPTSAVSPRTGSYSGVPHSGVTTAAATGSGNTNGHHEDGSEKSAPTSVAVASSSVGLA